MPLSLQISILIPTFNRIEMLCEALNQIIKHDCEEILEVIVSDNHSTDKTLEILREKYKNFSKLKLTMPTSACSPIENWKHALSLATGSHIHWHWSDDYLCGPFYQRAINLLKRHPASMVISAVKIVHEDGFSPTCYSQGFIRAETALPALQKLFFENTLPVSPAACILPLTSVKKHFYTNIPKVGIYDPTKYAMGTDALMIGGALLDTNEVFYLEEPLFCFRKHDQSITETHVSVFKSYAVAFEWFIRKEHLPFSLKLRREKFGLSICTAFEKKYSLNWIKGTLLEKRILLIYKIKMFFFKRGINLFKKKTHF